MEKFTIRKINANDIHQLVNISRQTFLETFSSMNSSENMNKYLEENLTLKKLTAELNNSDTEFYFAETDKQAIGYLKINTSDAQTELKNENSLEIERIYVLKEYLGKKAGQLLFDKALAIAKKKKVELVWLGVWEENSRAINFYKKNGFVQFDKHIFMLGDDEQTDIMM